MTSSRSAHRGGITSDAALPNYRSHPQHNPAVGDDDVLPLTDQEIESFLDELDHNGDGYITYAEVEQKLDTVYDELAPDARPHHLHHHSKQDEDRHLFLRSVLGYPDGDRIHRKEFARKIKEWKIPSMEQETIEEKAQEEYMKSLGIFRRIRSYWAVHGPTIIFMLLVVGMMAAFGIWQLVKYLTETKYRNALGWGVVVAKTCAGLLYPTLFFLLLSMCRYFATFMRRSYRVSRFINWDLNQNFHIIMACLATVLGTIHGIAHLTGDFLWIGNAYQPNALVELFGPNPPFTSYRAMVASLPGITGIIALALFYIIALLSMPQVRKWNYEIFQLAHLLMYPIIGLLIAHGTLKLLQYPMLGFFLAFPTLLIIVERSIRFFKGFHSINATIEILDSETIEIKAPIPRPLFWNYSAGQYIFLQVPEISFYQWHPFTISVCNQHTSEFQLHIKTDGNWTKKLRSLGKPGKLCNIEIGVDGPFGAPAQRFYDFSHTILVGAGIGVTPFSGILADLQYREDKLHGGPDIEKLEVLDDGDLAMAEKDKRRYSRFGMLEKRMNERKNSDETQVKTEPVGGPSEPITEKPSKKEKSKKSRQTPSEGNALSRNTSSTSLASALSRSRSRTGRKRSTSQSSRQRNAAPPDYPPDYRRTDFHWIVRDKNSLSWFSDLLNEISFSQRWWQRNHNNQSTKTQEYPHLDIRIWTHVTQKRNAISTHVYRWLLELHRTEEHPESPLTGLINPTHYGRPDFVKILDSHYEDMCRYIATTGWFKDKNNNGVRDEDEMGNSRFKVGVFYCGNTIVGEMIADICKILTARGRAEGTKIEYYFMMEVFG